MMLPAPAEWPHIDEFCAPSTYRAVSNLEKGKVCHMPTYRAFLHELMASFVPSDNDMVKNASVQLRLRRRISEA